MIARALALVTLVACVESSDVPTCEDFRADMESGAMVRADFGVRIVAPYGFVALDGAPTFPLSTGTLVMEPWLRDGALGAVGVAPDSACYWYAP